MQINRMIIAREGAEPGHPSMAEKMADYRERVFKDNEGKVFRDKVKPDPPVRGQYGYAFIPLKEGAVPTRAKPFFMHGERKGSFGKNQAGLAGHEIYRTGHH